MPLEPCRNVSRGHACRCLLPTAVPDLHLKSNSGYNIFVSLNQGCFDDFGQLRIATGPLAPVAFTSMSFEDNRLEVNFEKNPLHMRADRYDGVRLYLYNIDTRKGFLTAPVYRMDGRIGLVVPEWLSDGGTVYVYGFVQDSEGRCSESACLGVLGGLAALAEVHDGHGGEDKHYAEEAAAGERLAEDQHTYDDGGGRLEGAEDGGGGGA